MEENLEEGHEVAEQNVCLNCGRILEDDDKYCSSCGQIYDNKRVSFKDLVIDILGYFFFYDYRLKNSLKLMLFKPGQLSLSFIQGKKVDFIHPIRLYFIVSLIFFALVSINSKEDIKLVIDVNTHRTDTITEPTTNLYAFFGIGDSSLVDSNLIRESKHKYISLLKLFIIEKKNNSQMSKKEVFKKYKLEDSAINNYIFSKANYSLNTSFEGLASVIQDKFKLLIFIFLPFFVVFMYLIHYKKDFYYYENLIFAFNFSVSIS